MNIGSYSSMRPYDSDLKRSLDNPGTLIKKGMTRNLNGIGAAGGTGKSDVSDEIVSIGKKMTTRKIEYTEDDESPDYLLPSNGGYNPKQKSMWLEDEEVVVEIEKPKKLDYIALMKNNIKGMRRIHGDGRSRETLQDLSKNHLNNDK